VGGVRRQRRRLGHLRQPERGQDFTTAELKANVFAAGRPGDVLHGFGRPLHVGRRTQVWEVRITRNEEDRNAAFFTCTQMLIGASASA
jgi:1,4-dihydroxy-2-naphthoyl-CoA hydrolase